MQEFIDFPADVQEAGTGVTHEVFTSDHKTAYAVLRCLEIIGEAVLHNAHNPDRSFENSLGTEMILSV